MKNKFLEAMQSRHACKLFDENKKIPKQDLDYILECGRLSPSSFGMEQWRFLVIQDQDLKEKIKKLCWNQPQITTCSDLVIILAQTQNIKSNSPYPRKMLGRRGMSQDMLDGYMKLYNTFVDDFNDQELFAWSSKQTYIALANMMTSASYIGVDSCPIEGFEKENLEKFLNIDTNKEGIAVLVTFGYKAKAQPEKLRLPIEEIVEYR